MIKIYIFNECHKLSNYNFFLQKFLCKVCKNIFLKIFIKMKYFYIIYERIQKQNFYIKKYFTKIK